MSIERYSEKEIEYVVRAFKMYAKKVVKHSAIDYARKVNSVPIREVAFTDVIERNVSLSLFDSDTFFSSEIIEGSLEDVISDSKLKLAIHKLSEDEKKILALSIENYSGLEIARKLNLSEKTIRNKKSIIRSKIKGMLED